MVILLRTLTEDSILGFGKNPKDKISKYLDEKKTAYLRFIYFHYEGITFIDRILDKIYIPEEYRITKPGKCEENIYLVNKLNFNKLNKKSKEKAIKRKKLYIRKSENKIKDKEFSKKQLQRLNQGHKIY